MKLYTIQEIADILKLSHETVRRACTSGLIRAVRVGKFWRISQNELDRILTEGF